MFRFFSKFLIFFKHFRFFLSFSFFVFKIFDFFFKIFRFFFNFRFFSTFFEIFRFFFLYIFFPKTGRATKKCCWWTGETEISPVLLYGRGCSREFSKMKFQKFWWIFLLFLVNFFHIFCEKKSQNFITLTLDATFL